METEASSPMARPDHVPWNSLLTPPSPIPPLPLWEMTLHLAVTKRAGQGGEKRGPPSTLPPPSSSQPLFEPRTGRVIIMSDYDADGDQLEEAQTRRLIPAFILLSLPTPSILKTEFNNGLMTQKERGAWT